MNIYDLILLMWVTILTSVFIYFVIDMLGRTKKLYNTMIYLKAHNEVWVDPQLKNIRQLVTDEIINKKEERPVSEIEYLKCKFIAKLDDQTHHDIKVVVPKGVPYDYIWVLAIRECNKFESPLQQLSFVEEVTTTY